MKKISHSFKHYWWIIPNIITLTINEISYSSYPTPSLLRSVLLIIIFSATIIYLFILKRNKSLIIFTFLIGALLWGFSENNIDTYYGIHLVIIGTIFLTIRIIKTLMSKGQIVKKVVSSTFVLLLIIFVVKTIFYQKGYESTVPTIANLEQQKGTFTCPYTVKDEAYAKYTKASGEVTVVGKPQYIETPRLINNPQPFDQEKFEKELYVPASLNGLQYEYFDVDGDRENEKIISANTAMNHTPNLVAIVKDNNLIFEAGGANIYIDSVYGGNGFYLHETIDWNTGEIRITRYVYEDNGFKAIWYQKGCQVTFYDESSE